jgi:hypothetical protein
MRPEAVASRSREINTRTGTSGKSRGTRGSCRDHASGDQPHAVADDEHQSAAGASADGHPDADLSPQRAGVGGGWIGDW